MCAYYCLGCLGWGVDNEVEFIDIIDSNRFNGLSDLKKIYTNSEREKKIQGIIKIKVTQSLINHKNVHLTKMILKILIILELI